MTSQTILSAVNRPGRYLGEEYNAVIKDWDSSSLRFGLIFPDLYEIGMSHQGLQILYHQLNNLEDVLAERCYCPDVDVEVILRRENAPLTSLESATPLSAFDILGITLPYELCYTNILTILDLSSLPFRSQDRDESHPLIIGGGACALNPEPVADFFDAILLGDGEDAIYEIVQTCIELKKKNSDRQAQLQELSKIEGIYIPSFYQPVYHKSGKLKKIESAEGAKNIIRRRVLADLNALDHLKRPLVPNAKIVHDRLGVEVARGCTRGCRFCQAGITYRPVRERSPEQVLELAQSGLENSGFEELALLSLSTGDYSCLEEVLPTLMNRCSPDHVSVAMPSLRVGTLTPAIMDQIKRVRKTGFTLAPEAGSDRLRQSINKGITEEDLLATCQTAFALGWRLLKFYFMIGLPTETDEDLEAIGELVKKASAFRSQGLHKGKKEINVSVGTFVPKAHTPFQWEKQLTIDESASAIQQVRQNLPRKGCNLKYHSPQLSYLEGVFSRGDRRLADLLETAWRNGARLDGWSEHFDLSRWQEAASKCELDLDKYLEARSQDAPLPWQHLSSGVELQFLKDEFEKAKTGSYTPDCRYHGCQECGLCDFSTIFPRVHNKKADSSATIADNSIAKKQKDLHFKYMVHYSRLGKIAYLGHLEILQLIFRTLRRADIPMHYSQGFNPSPKVSFGPALPVGTESLTEYFIVDLYMPIKDSKSTAEKLNRNISPGITITAIEPHSGKIPQKTLVSYEIQLPDPIADKQIQKINNFLQNTDFTISKTRKGKTKSVNIRPIIKEIEQISPRKLLLQMLSEATMPGIKPAEAVKSILELSPEEILKLKICKQAWRCA